MLRKILFYIVLTVTVFTGPWWLFGIFFVAGFFIHERPWYIGLAYGFVVDMLTSNYTGHIPMRFSIIGLCLFFLLMFFKSYIRIPKVL